MNKYKQFSKLPIPDEQEIAITYGVKFLANPEDKPHRHNQERPFLVINKDNDDNLLALKISRRKKIQNNTDYYLVLDRCDDKTIYKASNIELDYVFELGRGDFIKRGFKLNNKDFYRILEKMMFCYNHGMTQISYDHIKKVHQKLYKGLQLKPGDIIKTIDFDDYLLIVDTDDKNYTCMRIHKDKQKGYERLSINLDYPTYLNYNEELIYIPRKYPFYKAQSKISKKYASTIKSKLDLMGLMNKRREFSIKLSKRLDKKENIG